MQKFSIRDIESMSGVKAHTLRIWEQRYDMFKAQRKLSQHRFYDNNDLKKLLRISFLYHNGWKISKIAGLSDEEMIDQVVKSKIKIDSFIPYILKLLEAAVDFNEKAFKGLLYDVINNVGFETCIREVCYPFLNRVGLLWMTNNIIPSQEHFSSSIIQHMIIAEINKLPKPPRNDEATVLFTPESEYHELPLLFIQYMLKKNGRNVIYLGKNVTWQNVISVLQLQEVKDIYLHLITNFTKLDVNDYLHHLCTSLPEKQIVISGILAKEVHKTWENLLVIKTESEIENYIKKPFIHEGKHSA
ncbi:MAG: MerR family transcriptional regulator [Bacteroidota bacterium]|nr:MerR family transcriptional regulator [Bacteroidota bacterium]